MSYSVYSRDLLNCNKIPGSPLLCEFLKYGFPRDCTEEDCVNVLKSMFSSEELKKLARDTLRNKFKTSSDYKVDSVFTILNDNIQKLKKDPSKDVVVTNIKQNISRLIARNQLSIDSAREIYFGLLGIKPSFTHQPLRRLFLERGEY